MRRTTATAAHALLLLAAAAARASAAPTQVPPIPKVGKWTPGDAGKSACGAGHDHWPFCNASLDLDARVRDLVSRIPMAAKPNLLTARGAGKGPGYAKTGGREALPELGVPSYYWGSNCLHASMFANCTSDGRCSTGFPSGPSLAAMWDRELWRSMASVVGQETRAAFNLRNFTDQERMGIGLDCCAIAPLIDPHACLTAALPLLLPLLLLLLLLLLH
jgi:hypothetical protein